MTPQTRPSSKHTKSTVIRNILNKIRANSLQTYADLVPVGATSAILKSLADEGLLIVVGSGIYASAKLDPFVAAVLATAKYYPQAVISAYTALQIHGLAEEFIEKIDVDIPRETSIRNRMLAVHRVPRKRIIGVASLDYHGGKIKIYDLERALCEAYRLDPVGQTFFKALKRYCVLGRVVPDQIARYDQILKTRVLTHLRQELADG